MCGRYTLMTDEDYKDLEEIVRDVSRTTGAQVKTEGTYTRQTTPRCS